MRHNTVGTYPVGSLETQLYERGWLPAPALVTYQTCMQTVVQCHNTIMVHSF